ncbi:MAG: NAD(P)H-dependent oxidoreductase subunit E [Deltaproteobacteria bacterium]|jgi:NADH:ubiquinone oxidoreductase subunit E|nr:NAD(P)H-dependent oxidoreductase subunit E [Deltaproteobacteria bacterium]
MKTIDIEICLGTVCFVMGSSRLQELGESLPEKFGDRVRVTYVRCLGACNNSNNFSRAPYVRIDGEIISSATEESIMRVLSGKVNHG